MLDASHVDVAGLEGESVEVLACIAALGEGEYEDFVVAQREPAVHLRQALGRRVFCSPLPRLIDRSKGEISWKVINSFALYVLPST